MEVLVSLVILSTGTVLVAQAMARVAHAQSVSERQTAAYLFAVSKFAELELAFEEDPHRLVKGQSGTFRAGQQQFVWTAAASPVSEGSLVHELELAISWEDRGQSYERIVQAWLRTPEEKG